MDKMINQKIVLIIGLLISVGGFIGVVGTTHKIFGYCFMLGGFIIIALIIYKLVLITKGKEKWGVF